MLNYIYLCHAELVIFVIAVDTDIVNNYPIISHTYSIVTVMVSVFTSDVVDRGFEPGRAKPQTIKFLNLIDWLSTQY